MATRPIPSDPERFDEAVDAFRKRVPMRDSEWRQLTQAERAYAFKVAEVAKADVIQDVFTAIDKAVEKGTTLDVFKEEVAGKLLSQWGGPRPGRLDTIFRTNVLGAYNEGRHAVFTAPAVKRARPYWRFDGVDDQRQSDICAAIDGTLLPADDPFWRTHTPGLHYNCRSTIIALSEEEAQEEGVDDEAPDAPAQDGFGAQPDTEGRDWEVDLSEYADEIAAELEERLK